jgi:hypothetical protein
MLIKRSDNFAPRGIAVRMKHTVAAMRAFPGEQQRSTLAVECRTPLDQLFDGYRAFFYQSAHGRDIAKAITGHQRVLLM